jgi:hypothetical protein
MACKSISVILLAHNLPLALHILIVVLVELENRKKGAYINSLHGAASLQNR